MDNSQIGSIANTDDSYIRRLIVAMTQFLYEKIKVKQIENGETKMIDIPFYYSQTGEEQFMTDLFLDNDRWKKELGLDKIKGNPTPVPSCVFTVASFTVNTQFLTSKYVRSNFRRRISTPFGETEKMVSARAAMLPVGTVWDMELTTSSDLQRLKVTEKLLKVFWRSKKFKFSYDGFDSLPCTVAFPTSYNIDKELRYQFPSKDTVLRPRIKFTLETLTYMPIPDEATERYVDNRLDSLSINMTPINPGK